MRNGLRQAQDLLFKGNLVCSKSFCRRQRGGADIIVVVIRSDGRLCMVRAYVENMRSPVVMRFPKF